MSSPHPFATHRYLDVMTVRPSQGARLTSNNAASMSPPPSAPTSFDGVALVQQLRTATSHSSRPNSPQEKARLQTSSIERLSARPKHSSPGLRATGLQSLHQASTHVHASAHKMTGSVQAAMGVAPGSGQALPSHNSLLVEPILLPSLHHVHVDNPQDLEESCLFYPNGHKNRNIRREIESSVVKHHLLENKKLQTRKQKSRYRIVRPDPFANVKGPPLHYSKPRDPVVEEIYTSMRKMEGKIRNTVQVIV